MASTQRRSSGRSDRSGSRRSSRSKILSPSDFRGKGAVPKARRKLAKGARKLSPQLNREIVAERGT